MYACGDCTHPAPDANGCPRCGGPTFRVGGGELETYRALLRDRATRTRAAGVLFPVLAILWGLQVFFSFGGDQLFAWLGGLAEVDFTAAGLAVAAAGLTVIAFMAARGRGGAGATTVRRGPAGPVRRRG
jgi:hypothetical protein